MMLAWIDSWILFSLFLFIYYLDKKILIWIEPRILFSEQYKAFFSLKYTRIIFVLHFFKENSFFLIFLGSMGEKINL